MERPFRILTVDGGGVRGVYAAHILSCIARRLGVDLKEQFDLFAGTSTGSIVASAAAYGVAADDVTAMYKRHAQEIFTEPQTRKWLPKIVRIASRSTYKHGSLARALETVFGDVTLGEIRKPLLIPATDVGHGGVHVFKSSYSSEFNRDRDVRLVRAIAASCAAPIYFDPIRVNEYLICDGGVWANNPSLAAIIDAKRRMDVDLSDIRILSLGTGCSRIAYGVKDRKWGFANGWRGRRLVDFLLSVQSESTNNYVQLLLERDQFLRINFESDCELPLDDATSIDDMIARADRDFTHHSAEISAFLA